MKDEEETSVAMQELRMQVEDAIENITAGREGGRRKGLWGSGVYEAEKDVAAFGRKCVKTELI